MFDESEQDGYATEHEGDTSGSVEPVNSRRKTQKKQKAQSEPEVQDVYILYNKTDQTCKILAEGELEEAGAKVVSNTDLELFRGTRLKPKITF